MRKLFLVAVLVLCAAPAFAQSCTATFQTESLPLFFVGHKANFQIEGVSGTPPYTFELVPGLGDPLPAGLTLKSNGRIKGKPTTAGDTTIFVRLTDAACCSVVQAFAVRVDP
jgi:hypothetical protein